MLLRLICTDGSLENGPGYLVKDQIYVVGRSSNSAFVVNDLSVSRQHAELTVGESIVVIRDLGSRNGTFLEKARITIAEAKPGQNIYFGNAQFQLLAHEQPSAVEHEMSEVSTAVIHAIPDVQPATAAELSKAERRVLDELLIGLGEKEVANKLLLSQYTVHDHIKAIYRKLQVTSRPELLALFVRKTQP